METTPLSSTSSSATPVRREKIADMTTSKTMLRKVLSQLEESNKNIIQICSLVRKHEELLAGSKSSKRERNKYVPTVVRVSKHL